MKGNVSYSVWSGLSAIVMGAALTAGAAYGADPAGVEANRTREKVVFVCEHGSSKSLVAATLFNKMAEQRGLTVRALSRAVSEKTVDKQVPENLARTMALDGF